MLSFCVNRRYESHSDEGLTLGTSPFMDDYTPKITFSLLLFWMLFMDGGRCNKEALYFWCFCVEQSLTILLLCLLAHRHRRARNYTRSTTSTPILRKKIVSGNHDFTSVKLWNRCTRPTRHISSAFEVLIARNILPIILSCDCGIISFRFRFASLMTYKWACAVKHVTLVQHRSTIGVLSFHRVDDTLIV